MTFIYTTLFTIKRDVPKSYHYIPLQVDSFLSFVCKSGQKTRQTTSKFCFSIIFLRSKNVCVLSRILSCVSNLPLKYSILLLLKFYKNSFEKHTILRSECEKNKFIEWKITTKRRKKNIQLSPSLRNAWHKECELFWCKISYGAVGEFIGLKKIGAIPQFGNPSVRSMFKIHSPYITSISILVQFIRYDFRWIFFCVCSTSNKFLIF